MDEIMGKIVKFIIEVAIIAVVGLLWHHIGYKKGYNKAVESIEPQIDTIYHFDTIRVSTPKYEAHWFGQPMLLFLTDSILTVQHDSTFVALPKEYKEFSKDSVYKAIVSGYEPNLDYIEVYQKTNIVNRTFTKIETVYPKRDYVSLRVDGLYDKSYIVPITLNFGYRVRGLDISAGAGYDPIQKSPVFRAGAELKIGFGEAR